LGEKSKESPVVGDESVGFTCTYNPYIDAEEWTIKIKEAMVKIRSTMVTYDKPNMNCDIYMSPEAFEDIKKWGVDEIDEEGRKEIMENGWDDHFCFSGLGCPAIHITEGLGRQEIIEFNDKEWYRYV
jgi:hypothetical protein